METQTAGSATAEATNPTMSPFYSRHDTGTASTEALNPNMNPFRTLSDSHDAIRSDAAEPPDYTRRPGNGENLLQTSPLLVSDDSTQQVQIHPSASITTPRYPSFPIEKPPARSKSVQFLGHQPGLKRGIQIPTRMSYVTSGFPLPKALVDAGVDEARWQQFSNEAKSHGAMSGTQWATVCAGGYGM